MEGKLLSLKGNYSASGMERLRLHFCFFFVFFFPLLFSFSLVTKIG